MPSASRSAARSRIGARRPWRSRTSTASLRPPPGRASSAISARASATRCRPPSRGFAREMDVLEARLRAAAQRASAGCSQARRDRVSQALPPRRGRARVLRRRRQLANDAEADSAAARLRRARATRNGSVLEPLGHPVPATLSFVHKGLGASILRASQRLWDGVTLNPAAVIKITRHNIYRPTALIHEAGHEVAGELGWAEEIAGLLERRLGHAPPGWARSGRPGAARSWPMSSPSSTQATAR